MDSVNACLARDSQDVLDVEVRLDRALVAPDKIGLVRLGSMQRESVLLRIDGDCPDPELARRPHHTNGDLATIGNQETTNPLRHGGFHCVHWRKVPLALSAGQIQRLLSARRKKAWFLPARSGPVSK